MSELLDGLRKMHRDESHLIRDARITIQIQLYRDRSKYTLKFFSTKSEEDLPIENHITDKNLEEIVLALKEVGSLINGKDENTITTFDLDEDGRISSIEHEFISGFKTLTMYRHNTRRILKNVVPQGLVEVVIGPLGRVTYPVHAEYAGSFKIKGFRFVNETKEDAQIVQMNSYVMITYLPKVMKHGARYHIYTVDDSLDSPIEISPARFFNS